MSWKGFTKGLTRLPTKLAQKTGYASETIDQEYQLLEEQFKHLEKLARRLTDEAKKFKDSLSAMLAHQARFAETLMEVYEPVTGVSSPARSSVDGAEDEGYEPSSPKKRSENPAALAAAESFASVMKDARERLLPDLEVIERQVVAPTNDYIMMINNVKRLMDKRARKLIDYDRHRDSVKKLTTKQDRNVSDEKKLGSLETDLDQSTREYNNVNNILKQELPIFISLRVAFIDPCFQTLYWYELKAVQVLYECFSELCNKHFNMRISAQDGFAAKYDQMIEMLSTLTLAKRPLKGNAAAQDDGYGSPDNSPTNQAPSYGQTESLPPYEEAASAPKPGGFAQPTASKTGFTPPTAYPNPFAAAAAAPKPSSSHPTYVIALYDFDGVEEGDLPFKKDDKIEVLERTPNAEDWWTGKCRGKVGQFPGNYVSEL